MRIPEDIPASIASSVLRVWPGVSRPLMDTWFGSELQRRTSVSSNHRSHFLDEERVGNTSLQKLSAQ